MNKSLQDTLHREIPLTKSMGIKVLDSTELSLTLCAPLEKNTNHKGTAFGGSLYSIAVLSGWGLLFQLLEQHNLSGHIVIQQSHTQFIKPVTSDIISTCSFDSKQQGDRFISMYQRKSKARIQLESHIQCNESEKLLFQGSYVLHN